MPVLTKYQIRELRQHAEAPQPINVRAPRHRVIQTLVDRRLLSAGRAYKPKQTHINREGRKALELLR